MKMVKVIGLVLALCALVLACSKPETSVVGKWVGKTGTFQFFEDKTGVIAPAQARPEFPASLSFKWTMEGSDQVRISPAGSNKITVLGKLQGDKVLAVENDNFVKQ